MAHKINLVFFAFGNSVPLVKELNAFYRDSNKFDVNNLNSVEEVNQFLGTSGQGIFFFKVTNKADLQKAVSVLKVQKKLIKNGFVKPACVTTIKNKKVEAVLAKYGCVDLLEPDTRAKTASFKLDFWSKPISTHLDQIAKEEERQLKKQESAQNNNEAKEAELFKFTEPLNLESDFWLIKSRADCKKVLRRWLVRVLGPSTFVGNWVELQPQPGDKQPTWKFVLKDPSNTDYVKNDGAWYFYGAKPEFDWKINRWSFSSDLPHLYFYTKSGEVFSRFKYVNGQVEIPMNSEFASTREEMILETCDAQYNFDAEKNKSEDTESLEGQEGEHNPGHMEGKNHAEEDLAGNMEGKGSTDDLGGDPLSGKSSTDELGGDPLAGKVNPGEVKPGDEKKDPTFSEDPIPGHMGGKSSTDDLGGDPLAGKVNPGEVKPGDEKKDPTFSEDPIPGHMGGKSSTDELGGDPLAGKVNPGEVKPGDEKKDPTFSEDPIPGHMGGKSSTDELGGDPLAGKVNPGEVKPGDEKKDPTFSEDPIPGHMGGKSSTDELGGDPLAGKVNPGEVKPGDEKKDPTFSEDPIAGHMGGKSSTDELGGDPLAGKVNPGEVKPGDEKKDPTFSEDPIPGHMGGKSSTDELGGDPLAGKVNPGEVKPGDEKKDPTFSEDPIAGHMGGKSSTDELGGDPLSGSVNQEGKNHGAQESSLANPLDELKKSSQKRPENEGSIYDKEDSPLEEKDDLSEYGVMDGFNPKAEKKDEDGTPIIESSKDKLTHPNKPGDEVSSRSEELTHPDENTHNQIDDTFSDNSAYSNTEYEADMLDALGGGLTKAEKLVHYEGSEQPIDLKTTYIGEAKKEEKKEGPDLNQIIGQEVNLDLESGQLKVVLKQKTSVGNDITFICEFEDFYEDELVVQAPKNSLAVGSHVRAMVSLLYKGEKVKVECAGTIEEIEELSEHKDTLIVTLEKINKENYEKFIALYQERQGSINEFMEMAKGY